MSLVTDDGSMERDQPEPGWYRDPSFEHRLRSWDGSAWTDYVWDRGDVVREPIRLPPHQHPPPKGKSLSPAGGRRQAFQAGCAICIGFLFLSFAFFVSALDGYGGQPQGIDGPAPTGVKVLFWLAGISFVLAWVAGPVVAGVVRRQREQYPPPMSH
jgi:hypothetical protein